MEENRAFMAISGGYTNVRTNKIFYQLSKLPKCINLIAFEGPKFNISSLTYMTRLIESFHVPKTRRILLSSTGKSTLGLKSPWIMIEKSKMFYYCPGSWYGEEGNIWQAANHKHIFEMERLCGHNNMKGKTIILLLL